MRLILRLTVGTALAILVALSVHGFLTVERSIDLFDHDFRRDSSQLGWAVAAAVESTWQEPDGARALALVEDLDAHEQKIDVHWVWIGAPANDRFAPRTEETLPEVLAGKVTQRQVRDASGGHVYTYIPTSIRRGDGRLGAVEIGEPLDERNAYVRTTVIEVGLLVLAVVLFNAIAVFGLGSWLVGQPVAMLIEKLRRVGRGDLGSPIATWRHDELGQLGQALDDMCDDLATTRASLTSEEQTRHAAEEQLRHSERLATVGKLAAGIAHELGTPLNVISMRAKLAETNQIEASAIADNSRIIREQAQHITRIIRQLLDFARRRGPQRAPRDLNEMIDQTLALVVGTVRKQRIEFVRQPPSGPAVASVDSSQLQQVFTNLVVNGVQSMQRGGTLTIGVRRQHTQPPVDHGGPEADYYCIEIRDQGCGIAPADRQHLFEPFFTTKPVGEGTGLGLAVAYGIMREHGGWIEVASEVGSGSLFSVFLPIAQENTDDNPSCAA